MLTRRQWIGSGVVAALSLGVAGLAAESFETNRDVLAAIVPVVLDGALPSEPGARAAALARTIEGFDVAVSGLTPSVQAEIAQLFALLRIAPLRIASTGILGTWSQTPPRRIAEWLTAWRTSRFTTLRSAYDALHQLINAAWYGRPEAWSDIGYPGPPMVRL